MSTEAEQSGQPSQIVPQFSLGPESEAFSCPLSEGNKLTVMVRTRRMSVADLATVREFMELLVRSLASVAGLDDEIRARMTVATDEMVRVAGFSAERRMQNAMFRTERQKKKRGEMG